VHPLQAFVVRAQSRGARHRGIIGAGIFGLDRHAARRMQSAVTLSFLLGAVACALAGLFMRDVLDRSDLRKRLHLRLRNAGELIAWIIGWTDLEYAVGAIAVASAGPAIFCEPCARFRYHLPSQLTSAPLNYDVNSGHLVVDRGADQHPAMLIIAFVTTLWWWASESRRGRRLHRRSSN